MPTTYDSNKQAHQAMDPALETAWKTEVARRVEEIQTGKVQGIPGEEVSAHIRKIVGR